MRYFFLKLKLYVLFVFLYLQTYKHPEWQGPYLGPKPSDECKRDFTEEQLRAGETIIGLQAGQNKGATQAGQNLGAGRKILLGKWTISLQPSSPLPVKIQMAVYDVYSFQPIVAYRLPLLLIATTQAREILLTYIKKTI